MTTKKANEKIWVLVALAVCAGAAVYAAHRRGCVGGERGGPAERADRNDEGVPEGWEPPPPIGSDPDYRGPDPSDPMRYSPYAMSTSTRVRRRTLERDNGDPGMAEAIADVARGVEGDIGYLGPSRDDRFESLGERLRDLDGDPFSGTDPAPVAEALQTQGFAFVLASTRQPRPALWLQPGSDTLRIRLRDGLPLSHFHPVIFSRSHILYRIAPPMELSLDEGRRAVAWVRGRLAGEADETPLGIERSTVTVGRDRHGVIVSLRSRRHQPLEGRRVTSEQGSGPTLEAALIDAVQRIRRRWAEARAQVIDAHRVTFPEGLGDALAQMEIEVEVMDRVCHIIDREVSQLYWQYELGLHGLFYEEGDRELVLSPGVPIWQASIYTVRRDGRNRSARHFAGERSTVQELLTTNGLDGDAWRREGPAGRARGPYRADFGVFQSHHWLERAPRGDVDAIYRGVPLVEVSDITRESLIRSLELGAGWLVRNQLDDGQFRYRYEALREDPDKRWGTGNNIVRHALNPYTLLLVNRVAPDDDLVAAARRGMAYTLEHLRREGNRCYIWHRDVPAPYENAKMGTVAVTILSILAMGDVMDISEYEDELSCLAEELLYMQDPNGHFRQYDVPPDHDYYGCENTIFPGELQLALARVYGRTRDARFRDAFSRAFDWYKRWWEINVARRTRDGIYNEEERPNLMGFVPWNVMALNEMHRHTGEARYADFAFQLQNWIDDVFLYDIDRTPYADYLGSYFKHHWELPAINSCGYTEGAGAAYALALRTGRDVERRRRALVLGARFALQLQYTGPRDTFFLPDPATAMGGYRYNLNRTRLRNDYSYHAMSAVSQAVEHLRPQDYPAQTPLELPETLAEAR